MTGSSELSAENGGSKIEFYTVESSKLAWTENSTPGFASKSLYEDGKTGQRTVLLKVEPGAYYGTHSHAELEQIYVIEGDFYDQNRSYGAGDFIVREPGTGHIAGSKNGSLILLFFI